MFLLSAGNLADSIVRNRSSRKFCCAFVKGCNSPTGSVESIFGIRNHVRFGGSFASVSGSGQEIHQGFGVQGIVAASVVLLLSVVQKHPEETRGGEAER